MSPEITLLLYVICGGDLSRYAITIPDRNNLGCDWEYWMEPDCQKRLKTIAGISKHGRIVRVEKLDGVCTFGERGEVEG